MSTQTISGTGGSTGWVHLNGPILLTLAGDDGGGTSTLETQDPDGTVVPVDGQVHTALGAYFVDMPPGTRRPFRVTLTGATAADLQVGLTD